MLSEGVTQTELEAAIRAKCPGKWREADTSIAAEAVMQEADAALEDDNAAWDQVLLHIKRINALLFALGLALTALGFALTLAPPARIAIAAASRAISSLTSRVEAFEGIVIARKAANDAIGVKLREAAKEGFRLRKAA